MAADAEPPDPEHPRIVVDGTVGGQPRLRGRRITVLDVYDGVEAGDATAAGFADAFGLSVAEVYHALAYYHDHAAEMADHRERRDRAAERVAERIRERRPTEIDPDA